MQHAIHSVIDFIITRPYTLRVCFGNGEWKEISLQPVLRGPLFGPLRDPSFFAQAKLDTEAQTIVWPNGADFDPTLLYEWDKHVTELAARAASWE